MSAVRLRPAVAADAARLRAWRNDPAARRAFFNPAAVGRAEHARWLASTLENPRRRLYVIELGRAPVGQVRLDLGPGRSAEVSVTVDRRKRGQGVGRRALLEAARRAKSLGLRKLTALVLADNPASAVAFLLAGYRFRAALRRSGRDTYRMERPL